MFHDNESSEISSLSKTKCIYYLSYGVALNVRGISKGCDNFPYYVLLKIRLWSQSGRVEVIFSFLIRFVVIILSFS